jgi:hypothetical protein
METYTTNRVVGASTETARGVHQRGLTDAPTYLRGRTSLVGDLEMSFARFLP